MDYLLIKDESTTPNEIKKLCLICNEDNTLHSVDFSFKQNNFPFFLELILHSHLIN